MKREFEYSVGVRNIVNNTKRGRYKSIEELDKDLDDLIDEIEGVRGPLKDLITKIQSCPHDEYFPATYTFQRRVMNNYVYVYERICKACNKPQVVQVDDKEDAPDWGKDATERYYNNGI